MLLRSSVCLLSDHLSVPPSASVHCSSIRPSTVHLFVRRLSVRCPSAVHLSLRPSVILFVRLFVRLSVCPYTVRLSTCLTIMAAKNYEYHQTAIYHLPPPSSSLLFLITIGHQNCQSRRNDLIQLYSSWRKCRIEKKCSIVVFYLNNWFIKCMFLTVFFMINIGNYRELLLKLFCMEFKLKKCFFLRKFNVRKLSLFDQLNTISDIASVGRGWVSTGRRFCQGVVGVAKEKNEIKDQKSYHYL